MRRLFAVAGALATTGCIFFVNDQPPQLGSTCEFQGQATACGQCVLSACSAQLDACCIDSTCASSLPSLDECAGSADSVSCNELATFAPDLAACLQRSCPACGVTGAGGDGGGSGSTSCSKVGDSCSCTVASSGEPANGFVCDTSSVVSGLCCADYGWPKATGTQCTCEPFSCMPESAGGYCSLSIDSSQTTSWSGGACCSLGSSCICESTEDTCPGTEAQYATCTVAAITCDSSQVQVSSCSF